MLQAHETEKHGPIDDFREWITQDLCPECGEWLWFVPAQQGRCHSGKFQTSILLDHYECPGCEMAFIEAQDGIC